MSNRSIIGLSFAVACLIGQTCTWANEEAERSFTLKILPLIKEKCQGCHGGDPANIKGDFRVLTRQDLLRGGESEMPAIVPGKPDEGTLIDAISWGNWEMPPKENDRLTKAQVELFRQWIKNGAPWPNEATQKRYRDEEARKVLTEDGMRVETSGGTSEQWTNRRYQPEDLWAFRSVKSASELLPKSIAEDQAIDYFIEEKLKENGLEPAEQATTRQLIRRVTYDLTGLPPMPKEVAAFEKAVKNDEGQAYRALIERLLNSPRYGEHWARHWLDVTRYADTGGMSNDYERSNMWRYRDYVIRAFNDDKPYNQFIIEQLAGDELADQSVLDRKGTVKAVQDIQMKGDYTPQEAEWIVATGFLRLGPWDNAMVEPEEARQIYLDDLVNITGQTFLSQTLRCCKCHDHKFDPIPTRDYYRIYAAFAGTHMAERQVPFLPTESRDSFTTGKAHVETMLRFAVAEKNKLINKRETAARAWFDEHELPYKNEAARKDLPDEEKPPRHVGLNYVEQGQLKVREQDVWIWTRRLERYQPMAQSVFNANASVMPWNGARKLRIKRKPTNQPLVNHILTGGALSAEGDQVAPGVLSATSLAVNSQNDDPHLLTNAIEGRRLGLARWIANPENPLTTRSIVNRIWQFHFGRGIAANSNNFGAKGAQPTHPELLDYLASEFVAHGWSIKWLHRQILLSDAFRRSTTPLEPKVIALNDPSNNWSSHFRRRRLSAEEIRDGMLSMTGEMVPSSGGVPIKPEINMEVALQPRMIQFSLAPAYQPSRTPEERNRRTIYAYHVRGQADPFTELLNQPNPNESCEQRETASVTPQVFTFLNSTLMSDRSIAFAKRLESESKTLPAQIDRAFQLVLGRPATPIEKTRLQDYVISSTKHHTKAQLQPLTYPTEITRSLVEELTGKPFQYQEILPVFEDYVPDTKPVDATPSTRALADLCLILLNTNEFLYVD